MKSKKFFSILLLYLFGISLIPCSFLTQAAEAATAPKDYSSNYHLIWGSNHELAKYKNYGVILGDYDLTLVKGDTYNRYITSTNTNYSLLGVLGDNAYMITASYFEKNPSIKIANLSNAKASVKSLPKLKFDYYVYDAIADNTNYLWFSVGTQTTANKNYYIMRLNPNTFDYSLYTYDSSKTGIAYNLKSDNKGNVWFRYTASKTYIGKLSSTGKKISVNNYTTGVSNHSYTPYVVDSNNNFYFYNDSNKVIKLSLKGKKFVQTAAYTTPMANAKVNELSVDKSGNLWFMNGTNNYTLFKVQSGKFNAKYNVTVGYVPNLAVTDDNHFTTTSLANLGDYGIQAIYTNVSIDKTSNK